MTKNFMRIVHLKKVFTLFNPWPFMEEIRNFFINNQLRMQRLAR